MPGYAIEPNTAAPILLFEPDTIDELYGRVLYGIKFDPETGKATLEVVGDDDPISLPQQDLSNNDDYVHWFASTKAINLTWRQTRPSHLYMEVV